MPMICPYIFVYGTLRRKSDHPKAKQLREHARFIGEGTIPGRLYHLGPYPGLLPHPADLVIGDLFEMNDPESLLQVLDDYEDAATGVAQLFKRTLATILLGDEVRHAWVYWYTGRVDNVQRIESGDWSAVKRQDETK